MSAVEYSRASVRRDMRCRCSELSRPSTLASARRVVVDCDSQSQSLSVNSALAPSACVSSCRREARISPLTTRAPAAAHTALWSSRACY